MTISNRTFDRYEETSGNPHTTPDLNISQTNSSDGVVKLSDCVYRFSRSGLDVGGIHHTLQSKALNAKCIAMGSITPTLDTAFTLDGADYWLQHNYTKSPERTFANTARHTLAGGKFKKELASIEIIPKRHLIFPEFLLHGAGIEGARLEVHGNFFFREMRIVSGAERHVLGNIKSVCALNLQRSMLIHTPHLGVSVQALLCAFVSFYRF